MDNRQAASENSLQGPFLREFFEKDLSFFVYMVEYK